MAKPIKEVVQPVAPVSAPRTLTSAPSNMEEGWITAVKRGASMKKAQAATKPQTQVSRKPKKPKLQKPSSAAVVLTLQPGVD